MPEIDILTTMMCESACISVERKNNKNRVTLEEESSNSSVVISGLPSEVLVIKADAFPDPRKVFAGTRGECKRADFIMIARSGSKKRIICIEMKASSKKSSHIIEQLYGARCVVEYMEAIGRHYWKCPRLFDGYEYRFISLRKLNMRKQPIFERIGDIHDSPEKRLDICYAQYLEYKHIAEARVI